MFHSVDEQTIIAQCTPRGSGALALLRISGINAIEIINPIAKLPSNKSLLTADTHTIHYGSIVDSNGAVIDHVMFLLMKAPKTFTGQDTVEITCHNNQFIIETIIEHAIAHGARLAQQGEFTKRAVINGKIDLVQAEAINELIHAQTQLALKQSLAQLKGSLTQWLASIEQELIKALALSEASFEFLDEEMEFAPQISSMIAHIQKTITEIKKTYNQQQQIRQGIRVAIIGCVNAGKSSLFNALLNQERAIVTAIAGTTRDAIEAGVYKNGNYWTLVDTAGLRQTDDIIEQEGIARSFKEAHKADIIILAYDSGRELSAEEYAVCQEIVQQYPNKIINVLTKVDDQIQFFMKSSISTQDERKMIHMASDRPSTSSGQARDRTCPAKLQRRRIEPLADPSSLLRRSTPQKRVEQIEEGYEGRIRLTATPSLRQKASAGRQDVCSPFVVSAEQSEANRTTQYLSDNPIALSSKTKTNIMILENAIEQKIATLFADIESPFLLNQRQFNLLLALEIKLHDINCMLSQKQVAYELLSVHLNDAIAHLAELSGKAISEAGMDMVFREFCVGK
jgi:tRNA modification GTPase